MLTEQVEIVHGLWGGEGDVFSFSGKHYRLDACPALRSRTRIPTRTADHGGRCGTAFRRPRRTVGRQYDVVYRDPEQTKQRMERISAACEAIGRDPATVRRSSSRRRLWGRTRTRSGGERPSSWSGRHMRVTRMRTSRMPSDTSSGRPSRF